jgi:hypothetical protein
MDERSIFDLSPQMSHASEKLFTPRRLLLMVGLLIAMVLATLVR